MNEFLDVLQQLGAAFMQLWLGLPDSVRLWLTVAAVVLVLLALGAAIKHGLTYRFRNALAKAFEPDFKPEPIIEHLPNGGTRRKNPSAADARRQCQKCFHVWAVRGGYITFISDKASYGMDAAKVETLAKAVNMTHRAKAIFWGGFVLRSWRNE